ncbi:MAG: hypothetical protein ACTIJH_06435 [Moraxellaceae bacterium]
MSLKNKNGNVVIFLGSLVLLAIILLSIVVVSYASERRASEGAKKDIAEINNLVESVAGLPESSAKSRFLEVVNQGLIDGLLEHDEYIEIMEAYSDTMKLEAF